MPEDGMCPIPPITLEDVSRHYPPIVALNYEPPKYNGKVLALARAVYEAVPQEAADGRDRFIESIARDYAPGNLWLLPTYERLTLPVAPYWPLACAFQTEREQKRRFDWFLWADDDILFTKADVDKLFAAAEKHNLPFVAALPYDRMPPHQPAVIEKIDGKFMKWVVAPPSGSYPVFMTGFLLCLFRRDIFDVVPEPWFTSIGPVKGASGIQPDWWWSLQMDKVGLQPWVCCDTDVIHLGMKQKVNRRLSEQTYASCGLPVCAQRGVLQPVAAPSGAITVDGPVYEDGRVTREDAGPIDWSDSTVCILTCDKHKDMLDLCLAGIRSFWPGINVAVLNDKDESANTDVPDDIRELARRVPFVRKVIDLPFLSKTDKIYCLDSDCFLFREPREWRGYRGLYVLPGEAGKQWLKMGAEIWDHVVRDWTTGKPIDQSVIFCGGCWSASRKAMFEDTRELVFEYLRETVRRGYDKLDPGCGVVCEQVLLNGLWHRAHTKNPLPNFMFPLDEPNPGMVILHLHQAKDSGKGMIDLYRNMLADKGMLP